jgi:uracil DNA glycosylase
LGGNPYDGYIDELTVANGLYLDCSNLKVPSYELRNFYKGLENEIFNGLSLHYKDTQSINYLTKQGVLMLNSALTIEEYGTHEGIWEPFTKHVMKILDSLNCPIVFIGEQAQSYAAGISNRWRTACLDDIPGEPSGDWQTGHVFRRVDDILEEQNKETIMWLNIDVPF